MRIQSSRLRGPISVPWLVLLVLSSPVAAAENVALNRPYTLSHPPNYSYCTEPGDKTDLTDGVRYNPKGTSLWTQKSTVGWASGERIKHIEIDLGAICTIGGLTFETAADARSQGTFPLAVLVFVSDDERTYRYGGNLINEAVDQDRYVVHTFALEGLEAQGRYVRLVTVRGGHYVFVDEIEVLGEKTPGLKSRKGDLTVDGITAFVERQAAVGRQNNSSLTLLQLAQTKLARQDTPASQVARSSLRDIRAHILERSQPESVDFRRGVPFTSIDTDICRVMGTYLEQSGRPPLTVRRANPWSHLLPFDWDESSDESDSQTLLRGEWGEMAWNITNGTSTTKRLKVTVTGPGVKLYEVKFVEAFGFRLRADALMPLDGPLELPPGMTKQLWLGIDTRKLVPRSYKGVITLGGNGRPAEVSYAFTVGKPALPERVTMSVTPFSYMHWNLPKADPIGVARDLHEHYVDTQFLISSYLPNFQADAEGNFVRPMDFSKMDQYMAKLPQTRLWIIWPGFDWDHREMHPKAGEPRRSKVFSQWLKAVIAHMKGKGLGYDQFAFMWVDEPSRKRMKEIVGPSCKLLKSIDPKAQVWEDITGDNTEAGLAEYADLIDIWCPTSERIGWDFWKDKTRWFYDSASDKGRSPSAHYRSKPWLAFAHGCTGNGFWTYTDNSHLWDDYAGAPTYSVVYDGPNGVISSKRWEAYRAGVEDYEVCRMLRDAIESATAKGQGGQGRQRGSSSVAAAKRDLARQIQHVLDRPDDPRRADAGHELLLQHLVRLSE